MKRIVEYVWLDGYTPEPNLRSKIKIIDLNKSVSELNISDFPNWGFDGSSTKQAEGNFSDCYLKPVRFYATGNYGDTIYVLCEVLDGNNQIQRLKHFHSKHYCILISIHTDQYMVQIFL